jgi:hypothetical protein
MKVKEFIVRSNSPKLEGLKVRTPKLVVGYIFSIGNNVVFLNNVAGDQINNARLFPQVVGDNKDVYNWDIVGDDVPINCDQLTSHKYIMNN